MQLFQVTVYFAHHSQIFSEVLVENGILDIVFKVWTSIIPGVAIYEHIANLRHSQDTIRVQCLVVLGALALHSPDVIAASERNQYYFSLAELDHTRILSTQMFIFSLDDSWYNLGGSVLNILSSRCLDAVLPSTLQLPPETPLFMHPWKFVFQSCWFVIINRLLKSPR